MWEICQPPEHWSSNGDCHYSFNGDGVSLTAYRNGFEGVRPLRVTTNAGDNWFRLADSTLTGNSPLVASLISRMMRMA